MLSNIENDISIFQISIDDLEEFSGLLIDYYESGNDDDIIKFMKERCIKRVK